MSAPARDPADMVDVLVIGAGPAGLGAATAAAEAGASVLLLDNQPAPGGQIWRAAGRASDDPLRRRAFGAAAETAQAAIGRAEAAGVQRLTGAEVVDLGPAEGTAQDDAESGDAPPDAARPDTPPEYRHQAIWLHRGETHRMRRTLARTLVLATGAMERPVLFPGAGLPGVMGVGALQIAMKQGAMVPDGPVVLAGQGPLMLLTLAQLRGFGAQVALVASPGRRLPNPALLPGLVQALASGPGMITRGMRLALGQAVSGVRVAYGLRGLTALGQERIEAVQIETDRGSERIDCAVLAVHDGVVPDTQMARLLRLQHRWDPATACFVPQVDSQGRSSAPGIWVAGDGAGIAGWEGAQSSGWIAGLDAARSLAGAARPASGRATPATAGAISAQGAQPQTGATEAPVGPTPARRFLEALYPPMPVSALASEETMLCHCEGVTVGAARTAIREGATGPNRVKTATRCGMGPCQGRMCGQALTRLIAEETGQPEAEIGALRIRPPLKPILAADYATLAPPPGAPE